MYICMHILPRWDQRKESVVLTLWAKRVWDKRLWQLGGKLDKKERMEVGKLQIGCNYILTSCSFFPRKSCRPSKGCKTYKESRAVVCSSNLCQTQRFFCRIQMAENGYSWLEILEGRITIILLWTAKDKPSVGLSRAGSRTLYFSSSSHLLCTYDTEQSTSIVRLERNSVEIQYNEKL